ncbi:MAG: hypothetical protein A2Z88_03720 [Omnitrophica WOR_2 bacterium GWA2_47_8]|nr:MAG: hypothetical protein A2Z88_03720 [Omnitrophica WOR_2 bacterium GWA2_47_8]
MFNCTADIIPWVHTQWLGSFIYYLVFEFGGLPGLKIFRTVIFILILSFFIIKSFRYIPAHLFVILILLISFGLNFSVVLRPLLFNFIFIQIYLIILFNHRDNKGAKPLLFIPLLSILWFNLHVGVFVFGTLILGVFLFSYLVKYIESKYQKNADQEEAALCKSKIHALLLVIFGHFAAFLINPYGLKGAIWPYYAIVDPAGINRKLFFNSIIEMMPPSHIFSWQGIWFYLLVIAVIYCLNADSKTKLTEWLLFIVSLFSFLYSSRGFPLFICICITILWRACRSCDFKSLWSTMKYAKPMNYILHAGLALFLLVNIFYLLNQTVFLSKKPNKIFFMDLDPYNPVDALALLKKSHITGPAFAWEGYGGSIIWNAYPDIKPIADGRQVNPQAYLDYLKITNNPKNYWDQMQSKYRFNIAILDANFGTLHQVMDYLIQDQEWKMIFIKGSSVVFVRRGIYSLPAELDAFEDELLKISPKVGEAIEILNDTKGLSITPMSFLKERLIVYSEPLEEGVALYTAGFKAAGLNLILDAYRYTPSTKTRKILKFVLTDFTS